MLVCAHWDCAAALRLVPPCLDTDESQVLFTLTVFSLLLYVYIQWHIDVEDASQPPSTNNLVCLKDGVIFNGKFFVSVFNECALCVHYMHVKGAMRNGTFLKVSFIITSVNLELSSYATILQQNQKIFRGKVSVPLLSMCSNYITVMVYCQNTWYLNIKM